MKLTEKMMMLLITFSIIPVIVVGLIVLDGTHRMGITTIQTTESITNAAIADSSESLTSMAEDIIRQRAEDTAAMINIYINDHPEMTVEDLQADKFFQSIAVQVVGSTGYTALTDVKSLICRFHMKETVTNADLHDLAGVLPEFWDIMARTEGGAPSHGYYDWKEPDGTIKPKYMYIAIVDSKTADDVQFSVAATTYIDEFLKPVDFTSDKIEASFDQILMSFNESSDRIRQELFVIFSIVVLGLVIFGLMFSHSVTQPIKALTVSAQQIIDGNLDYPLPNVRTRDEVKELGDAMGLLIGAVKYHKQKSSKSIATLPVKPMKDTVDVPEKTKVTEVKMPEPVETVPESEIPTPPEHVNEPDKPKSPVRKIQEKAVKNMVRDIDKLQEQIADDIDKTEHV